MREVEGIWYNYASGSLGTCVFLGPSSELASFLLLMPRDKEEREGYLLVLPTFPSFLLRKYFLRQRAIRETDLDKLAITASHAPASASSTAE